MISSPPLLNPSRKSAALGQVPDYNGAMARYESQERCPMEARPRALHPSARVCTWAVGRRP